MKSNKILAALFSVTALGAISPQYSFATNLSLGADYFVRGVSVVPHNTTLPHDRYYDQRLQAYLTTDLSKDVEATVRIQSITPWGLEGSTTPLVTRYPNANGTPWVQNAFVRLPNIWQNRIILTVGRQPLQWGDGEILSDDDLGFNAIRAQVKSPFRRLPINLEAFTAKITEGLTGPGDTDLNGVMLSFDHEYTRWEIMDLMEKSDSHQEYEMGASTYSVLSSKLNRQILGVRMKVNLRDAYLKGAYYTQKGKVKQVAAGTADTTLGGSAFSVGLGAKVNTPYVGRFGTSADFSEGGGDDPNTPNKDEAFRPTFASRWSGLERKGYGKYFAATFSDVYSSTFPFQSASTTNSGLPAGTSGVQVVHLGADMTPWAQWTFSFDFYKYKALKNLVGPKALGTEFDYALVYRYSGLVNFKASYNDFKPGDAFDVLTRQKATYTTAEVEIKF